MTMLHARNWWAIALRGAVALIIGILALFAPLHTLQALILLFGVYAIVDGVLALVAAFRSIGEHRRWLPLLIEGILGIVAGIVALVAPGLATIGIVYVVAVWAIITGVFEIVQAFQVRRQVVGEIFLIVGGALSVVFGLFALFEPLAGALALVLVFGVYAIIFGILLLGLAFRVRSLRPGETLPNAPTGPMGGLV